MRRSMPTTEMLLLLFLAIGLIGNTNGFSVQVPKNDNEEHGGGGGQSGSGDDGGKSKGFGTSCVYELDDTLELCHLETARQMVQFELLRGPTSCKQFVVEEIDCLGCKYVPNKDYSPCDNGHKHKYEELVPGSKAGCPHKRKITKKCTAEDYDDNDDGHDEKKTIVFLPALGLD